MEMTVILFWVFSLILIASSIRVITAQSSVHAALALVLCFFQAAFIWMLLKAEFLAIALILVYVGAVMVLFLFVVMMLDLGSERVREGVKRYFLMGSVVAGILVFEISAIIYKGFYTPLNSITSVEQSSAIGQTKYLGLQMFTRYAFAVEVASVILLVAVVAAVSLTLRRRKDVKYNNPHKAIHTQAKDRVRLVKIQSVSNDTSSSVKSAYPMKPSTNHSVEKVAP
jgi:NADH-quinone oxidoreductase subunit J